MAGRFDWLVEGSRWFLVVVVVVGLMKRGNAGGGERGREGATGLHVCMLARNVGH